MGSGIRFRRDCPRCGRTFFTPNRKEILCQKCLKAKEEEKRRTTQSRQRAYPKGSRTEPKGGPPSELGPARRAQIFQAFLELRDANPDAPKRQLHLTLARKFGLRKDMIAKVIQEEREQTFLTEEVRRGIVERYVAYVERMERPKIGRRKSIASELRIPFRQVAKIVREWRDQQPRVSEIPRAVRFEIEKAYFRSLAQGMGLKEIVRDLSEETGFTLWQVHRYLDLIHDGEKLLRNVPDISPEELQRIEVGYHAYLSAAEPPKPFLHDLLAQQVGVHFKQVHKVLLNYRLRFRKDHLGY